MPRTWSYRKREIVVNEVKPKGTPPAAVAYLILSVIMVTIVVGLAVYTVGHPMAAPVIVGPHSDSYQTVDPDLGPAAH
jgi:hypothetical protein